MKIPSSPSPKNYRWHKKPLASVAAASTYWADGHWTLWVDIDAHDKIADLGFKLEPYHELNVSAGNQYLDEVYSKTLDQALEVSIPELNFPLEILLEHCIKVYRGEEHRSFLSSYPVAISDILCACQGITKFQVERWMKKENGHLDRALQDSMHFVYCGECEGSIRQYASSFQISRFYLQGLTQVQVIKKIHFSLKELERTDLQRQVQLEVISLENLKLKIRAKRLTETSPMLARPKLQEMIDDHLRRHFSFMDSLVLSVVI